MSNLTQRTANGGYLTQVPEKRRPTSRLVGPQFEGYGAGLQPAGSAEPRFSHDETRCDKTTLILVM
jgi:predicted RNase H-like nuclease